MAAALERAQEPRLLGRAADQAQEREVTPPQHAIADVEIELVRVREDQEQRAGWRILDRFGQSRCHHMPYARRNLLRESVEPAIEPSYLERQVGQHLGQRPPDMAGAEQPQRTRPAAHRLDDLPALAVLDDARAIRAVGGIDPALGAVAGGRQQARTLALDLRLPLRQPAPVDLAERLQQQAHRTTAALPEAR